jgi:hypothetical protein
MGPSVNVTHHHFRRVSPWIEARVTTHPGTRQATYVHSQLQFVSLKTLDRVMEGIAELYRCTYLGPML